MKAEKRTNQFPLKLTPALSDSNCSDVVDNDFGFRFALVYAIARMINQHHSNAAVHCILDARIMMLVQFAIQSLTHDHKCLSEAHAVRLTRHADGQDARGRDVCREKCLVRRNSSLMTRGCHRPPSENVSSLSFRFCRASFETITSTVIL
jgi:hypothetical protein